MLVNLTNIFKKEFKKYWLSILMESINLGKDKMYHIGYTD